MKEVEISVEGDQTAAPDTVSDTVDNDSDRTEQEQEPVTGGQVTDGGDQEIVPPMTSEPELYQEPESEEASPGQHNSSGYASDGSTSAGPGDLVQCPAPDTGMMAGAGIQSDPHQSAFRPAAAAPAAMPGQLQPAGYHGMDQHQAAEYQYRQNGGPGHNWTGHEDMANYGPPIGMMTQAAPHPMTGPGHPQMHTPIARRPITGNMSGYPPNPGYRPAQAPGPAHFPTSPGPGPQHNQYRPAPAFSGGQCGGWGSPSWSGNGPPSGPPPMSMTPPPLSWNQAPNRRPPNFPQQNKPFGNVQYGGGGGGGMMQNQIRSKNYPFPSKALNQGKIV